MNPKLSTIPDSESAHAWLVGSGIASLAAAVHLIKDAQMPGPNIHILDRDSKSGGGITSSGDPEKGFVIYPGSLPYFHAECVKKLLCLKLVALPNIRALNGLELNVSTGLWSQWSHLVP